MTTLPTSPTILLLLTALIRLTISGHLGEDHLDEGHQLIFCEHKSCQTCLQLAPYLRNDCFGEWISSMVRVDQKMLPMTTCAAIELQNRGIIDDCYFVQYYLGQGFADPKDDGPTEGPTHNAPTQQQLTFNRMREDSQRILAQCNDKCNSGCYHGVVSKFLYDAYVRPEMWKKGVFNQKRYLQEITPYCDLSITGKIAFACLYGIGLGFHWKWDFPPQGKKSLFTYAESSKLCHQLTFPKQTQKEVSKVCVSGLQLVSWNNAVIELKERNPTQSFQQLHSKYIALMRSFCSKEWAGNDVAGKCGEFAGLTVYDNYEQNATLALNMCNEAYGSETTAAIETASPMDDCVAAIQREVTETDEEGEDDDGGVDGRLLEDHSSPDHPSSGEGAHTPEQQQGGGQQGGPPQDASKQKIICHKGCGLLCMPAGVNSDGSGQEKLKFDQEHGPPTSDNNENENTKDSSAATPPATTTSGSTSTTPIPSATTESSITTSTPPTPTSTTTAAATAAAAASVASTVAVPAEGEPEEAAAAATSTKTRIESAMDQDPTNPKTLTEFDVGIQKPSFGETLMINFVMIAAIGASVGTVVLLAAKKMKLNNQKKYSQISQIIEEDEEDVEMHQSEGQSDTDEEDEDGERFCLVEPRRISE